MTDREILERLIVSLTTCENQGDTLEAIERAANLAGITFPEYGDMGDLSEALEGRPGLWS